MWDKVDKERFFCPYISTSFHKNPKPLSRSLEWIVCVFLVIIFRSTEPNKTNFLPKKQKKKIDLEFFIILLHARIPTPGCWPSFCFLKKHIFFFHLAPFHFVLLTTNLTLPFLIYIPRIFGQKTFYKLLAEEPRQKFENERKNKIRERLVLPHVLWCP